LHVDFLKIFSCFFLLFTGPLSLAHFSEDSGDSPDSSNQEDDYESDENQSEANDADDMNFIDEQLERCNTSGRYHHVFEEYI